MTDERQLVRNCLKGRPDAQRELYDRYAGLMLGICYRYTKSLTDAEDVLQDGFVKVFRHLHTYKFEGELGAWIRRIMVTTALNFLKKHSRYRTDLSFDNNDALHPVIDSDAEVKMTAREVAELVRQLPTGYQTIFNLHAVEGFSHVEIGQMLGISDGTSRSQYARARQLLMSWMETQSMIKTDQYAGK
ncbi:MAG: sigma-70 family RNA polymerase sigma factor [Chitinophagales bacterium]|nr:sigma-70 family RNA polymerase sigma factor [Chitinophagales bacterium]